VLASPLRSCCRESGRPAHSLVQLTSGTRRVILQLCAGLRVESSFSVENFRSSPGFTLNALPPISICFSIAGARPRLTLVLLGLVDALGSVAGTDQVSCAGTRFPSVMSFSVFDCRFL
jgi:hypothetical protein